MDLGAEKRPAFQIARNKQEYGLVLPDSSTQMEDFQQKPGLNFGEDSPRNAIFIPKSGNFVPVCPSGVLNFLPCQQMYLSRSTSPMIQYAVHSRNGPYILPDDHAISGEMSGYQISSAAPGFVSSLEPVVEKPSRRKEIQLMKNREAARECRRKKKEYVKCLENRVAVLENQNKRLIEELKALKDIYSHKTE